MKKESTFTPGHLLSHWLAVLAKMQVPVCSQVLVRKSDVNHYAEWATGSGHFKPFCRLNLTSDLRWSTMLFITHLIVNERKCNQQLLSTLYMESRRLLSPEKMWSLMEPRKFLLPTFFGGRGCVLGEERRVANMMRVPCHCCHIGSLAAKA